MTVGF